MFIEATFLILNFVGGQIRTCPYMKKIENLFFFSEAYLGAEHTTQNLSPR